MKQGNKAPMNRYEGKVVVVTGAASGIGRAVVERVSSEGAAVVALDRSELVHEVAAELAESGGVAVAQVVDVSDGEAVAAAITAHTTELGRIDAVCGAAGILETGTVAEGSLEVWDKTLAVNLRGQLNLLRACLPRMREREVHRPGFLHFRRHRRPRRRRLRGIEGRPDVPGEANGMRRGAAQHPLQRGTSGLD